MEKVCSPAFLLRGSKVTYLALRRLPVEQRWPTLRLRLWALEDVQAWRACLGLALGSWTSRMAHRVQRDGERSPWRKDGRALRWSRSCVSSSRQRNRSERGALSISPPFSCSVLIEALSGLPQLPTVGQLLPPHRASSHRRTQDVQVAQELHHDRRRSHAVHGSSIAIRVLVPDLERQARLQGGVYAGGSRRGGSSQRAFSFVLFNNGSLTPTHSRRTSSASSTLSLPRPKPTLSLPTGTITLSKPNATSSLSQACHPSNLSSHLH